MYYVRVYDSKFQDKFLHSQHWIRLEIQRNILIEQLSIHVEQSDASYMPSLVAVLAGNTIGGLKEIKQTSIPSGQREFVLVSGLTQVKEEGERRGKDRDGVERKERDRETGNKESVVLGGWSCEALLDKEQPISCCVCS